MPGGMGGMGEMLQKMMSNPKAMALMQKAQANPKVCPRIHALVPTASPERTGAATHNARALCASPSLEMPPCSCPPVLLDDGAPAAAAPLTVALHRVQIGQIMAALQDVQTNGPQAMQKYAGDSEIMEVVQELQQIMK